jgi:AraC-like DNA-binding protein
MASRKTSSFGDSPIGTHVVGRTFVIWCAARDLIGTIQWGSHDERDMRELLALMDVVRHPTLAPAACVLMDMHAIESVDAEIMLRFVALARDLLPRWSPHIARQAVIVPGGLTGVLLAGPLPLLGPTHPFKFVATAEAAFEFLDHPAAAAAHGEMVRIAMAARGAVELAERLRRVLAGDLAGATLERAASLLGTSARSLQRELRTRGTSFTTELRRARVAAAAELLRLDRDTKAETIAVRIGFGSSSRMAAALRRELGVTAAALRPGAR